MRAILPEKTGESGQCILLWAERGVGGQSPQVPYQKPHIELLTMPQRPHVWLFAHRVARRVVHRVVHRVAQFAAPILLPRQ
ncbi:MAG: hypothetical protein MUF49_17225 [Oculatellaceae cyanobacterium Prado106]|nr:hypothetical protein [Oculatellaceae cyanobacterium Prado106]